MHADSGGHREGQLRPPARIGRGENGRGLRARDTRLQLRCRDQVVDRNRPAVLFDFWVQSIESQRRNIDETT